MTSIKSFDAAFMLGSLKYRTTIIRAGKYRSGIQLSKAAFLESTQMRSKLHLFIMSAMVCALQHSAVKANSFSINSGQVSVGLNNGSTNAGAGTNVLSNPLIATYANSLNASAAQAEVNLVWTPDVGDFSIVSSISCQGPISQFSFGCSSSGKIDITTTADVILRSDIGLTWHLPSGDREATIDLDVANLAAPLPFMLERACGASNIGGSPPDGSCGFFDEGLLPAGGLYRVIYAVRFRNFSGSSSVLSTGTSAINLHLEPAIPEPSTLTLLVLGATLVMRCSRR